jgi:hypothetical protein
MGSQEAAAALSRRSAAPDLLRGGIAAARESRVKRPSVGLVLLLVFLLGLLALAIWGFITAWNLAGNTQMSIHGWIAMGLAAVLTLGLGGGLMWLAFYSSRRGYDDDQGGD